MINKTELFENTKRLLGFRKEIFDNRGTVPEKQKLISQVMEGLAALAGTFESIQKPGMNDVISDVMLYFELLNMQYVALSERQVIIPTLSGACAANGVRLVNKLECILFEENEINGYKLNDRLKAIDVKMGELLQSLISECGVIDDLGRYDRVFIYGAEAEAFYVGEVLEKLGAAGLCGFLCPLEGYELAGRKILSLESTGLGKNDAVIVTSIGPLRKYDKRNLEKYGVINVIELNVFDDRNYEYYSRLPENLMRFELKWWYENLTKDRIDFDHPVTFNQKIQWMKLYDRDKRKTLLADKYLVRDWVRERIGREHLIPLLGVYDSFDDIDFDALPDRFVLKYNHGSGFNVLVRDKAEMDMAKTKARFDKWRGENYAYYTGFELHYKNIIPKIVAEEMLISSDGEDLKDYKIFVFDGVAKMIQVDFDRFTNHKRNLYTPEWEYIDCLIGYPTDPDKKIPRPVCLEELILLAEKLGSGFAHVRVDFYVVAEKIYFGEMTFTHESGIATFYPPELGVTMGGWIDLDKCVRE